MAVTALDVRQWLYRYLQRYTGWFDTPAWRVEGDEYIPMLVRALEGLADYVGSLNEGDERLVALADALNEAGWLPERLDAYLYPQITGSYGLSIAKHPPYDEFIDSYSRYAVGVVRAHARHRSLVAASRTLPHCAAQKCRRAVPRAPVACIWAPRRRSVRSDPEARREPPCA